MALPLVAIRYARSPALVAGLELVQTLPWLVGSLQVGALTDRFDRRHSMMARPILRTMALMVGVANLASSAAFAVIVLFAVGPRSPLGLTEPQFGLLFATMAGGAVVGGLVGERVQTRIGRARSLTLSLLGMIAYILTPALTTNLAIIVGVFFTGGLTVMIWNIITVSFRQRVTADPMLGRVNSAYRLVA